MYDELITLVRSLLAAPAAVGMQVTIFDPDLDPDGSLGRAHADALVAAFRSS